MKPFRKQITSGGKAYNSLRIGDQVPPNSVNLAYIYNKELDPEENIQIIGSTASDVIVDPNDNLILMWTDENGVLYQRDDHGNLSSPYVHSDSFSLSNKFFKNVDITEDDAYNYKYYLKGYHVDAISGLDGESGPPFTNRTPSITVSLENGEMTPGLKYRIYLKKVADIYRQTTGGPIAVNKAIYQVLLYTNFTSDLINTFTVRYNKASVTNSNNYYYLNSQENSFSETINGISIFLPRDVNDMINETPYHSDTDFYDIAHTSNGYKITVPNFRSQADGRVRQSFYWKIQCTSNGNTVESQWMNNEVINEINSTAKFLSTMTVSEILRKYDSSFPNINPGSNPAAPAVIFFYGQADDSGRITSSAQSSTTPRVDSPFAVGELRFFIDANDKVRAYTTNPDNSQVTEGNGASIQSLAIPCNVKLQAYVMQSEQTFSWNATAFGSGYDTSGSYNDHTWVIYYYNANGDTHIATETHWENENRDDDNNDYAMNYRGKFYFDNRGKFSGKSYYGVATAYYWVPYDVRTSLRTEWGGVYTTNCFLCFVNDTCVYAYNKPNNDANKVSFTLKAGWNKLQFQNKSYIYTDIYGTHDGNPVYVEFHKSLSNILHDAGIPYAMNSSMPNYKYWSNVYSGSGTVTDAAPTYTFSTSIPLSDVPSWVDRSTLHWAIRQDGHYVAISGLGDGGSFTDWADGVNMGFTARIGDGLGTPRLVGESEQHEVFVTDEVQTENNPVVVGRLLDLMHEAGVNDPVNGSKTYDKLFFRLACSDKRINLRFSDNFSYFTSEEEPVAGFLDSNIFPSVFRKNISNIAETNIVAWTNSSSGSSLSYPFVVRMNSNRGFYVAPPAVSKSDSDNWYIRIHNANVLKRVTIPAANDPGYQTIVDNYPSLLGQSGTVVTLGYSLAEFDRQIFSAKPIVDVSREEAEILDSYTIKVSRTPICLFKPIVVEGNTVKDVQAIKGEIKLTDPIPGSITKIYVSYSYSEEWVSYSGFFDGKLTSDFRDAGTVAGAKFWHLDLNPAPHHTCLSTDIGIPGHKSLSEYSENDPYISVEDAAHRVRKVVPTNSLVGVPIYVYLYPRTVMIGNAKVKNKYDETDARTTIYHTTIQSVLDDPFALCLGKVYIQPNSSLKDMVVIDTRTRGGGLSESISKTIISQVNPEASYYWDIGYWDGQPYQENGVVFFRLPKEILKKFGGRFTDGEVKEIVKKHLALGVLPQIEYSDMDYSTVKVPDITNLRPIAEDDGGVTVYWDASPYVPMYKIMRNGEDLGFAYPNGSTVGIFEDPNGKYGDSYYVRGQAKSIDGMLYGKPATEIALYERWDEFKGKDEANAYQDDEIVGDSRDRGGNFLKKTSSDPEYV
jgi:hypothetical protein